MKHGKGLSENNLIRFLKTLSKAEFKQFTALAVSPYFSKGRNYLPLLKALDEFHPAFDSSELSKEFLYSKLFPGKQYKESVIKSMLSRLDELADEFIVQTALNKDTNLTRERLLLRESGKRGLQNKALSVINRINTHLSTKKRGLHDNFAVRDFLNEVSNFHVLFNDHQKASDSVLAYQKSILYAFLAEFLLTEGTIYSQKLSWSEDLRNSFILRVTETLNLDSILDQIKKHDPENYSALNLFNLLRLAVKDRENDERYYSLRDEFYRMIDDCDVDLRQFMFRCMVSVLTGKGKNEALLESHKIQRKILEENLYLYSKQNRITTIAFRSAFIEAVYLGEFDWAEEFFNRYIEFVQPSHRKSLTHYCNAMLLFSKSRYDDALANINEVRINLIHFKLDARILISQIYYQTGSFESLISFLDSFSKFLVNFQSQNADLMESHGKFIRYFRRLAKLRLKPDDDSETALLKETLSKDRFIMKQWLTDRVNELLKSAKRK